MILDIVEDDRYIPTPDSTPGNVTVIFTVFEPTIQQQQIRGNSFILNRDRFNVGRSRIKGPPIVEIVYIIGTTSIRNPLDFLPGFQQTPLLTNTELQIESQKGVSNFIWESIKTWFGFTRITAATSQSHIGVSRIGITTLQSHIGVSIVSIPI